MRGSSVFIQEFLGFYIIDNFEIPQPTALYNVMLPITIPQLLYFTMHVITLYAPRRLGGIAGSMTTQNDKAHIARQRTTAIKISINKSLYQCNSFFIY